mmetsp:Transcript_160/g.299  ORF Transcript_160/g.299 Transcript_160/m.299 type:complete len:272 (-) Transcript_160:111-926(-)
MMGNPMMGNPMMGNPMMSGNPMMGGNPMMNNLLRREGVMPGVQAPEQFGHTHMFLLDPPRRDIKGEMPLVPGISNFMPPPPLLPAQSSHYHPLIAHSVGEVRLPNAYRMYQYGPSTVFWAPVAVPEHNTGIMVNAEFPMQSWMEGRFLDPNKPGKKEVRGDHFIRNEHWMMLNPKNLKPYSEEEAAKLDPHEAFGDYALAQDLADQPRNSGMKAEEYIEEKYKKIHEEREDKGFFSIDKVGMRNMELEILDEQKLREFWADPNAIIQDSLE